MISFEATQAIFKVLSNFDEEGRSMPLEPLLREITKALDDAAPTTHRESPVIVMYARCVNIGCRNVHVRDTSEDEATEAAN